MSLPGQLVKHAQHDLSQQKLIISCKRDRRYRVLDPLNDQPAVVNRYVSRTIRDLPLCGYDCHLEVELAQVIGKDGKRRMERCEFVDKGSRYTLRLCRLVSGLCRHMSIKAVSQHLKIRWETVKNMDKHYLESSLPALDPTQLIDLKYIGVDEVARAKGHDYMTVVYDMVEGHLIWVEAGRTAEVFSGFLKQLPKETAENIEAVAMDMGPAYQKSVRDCLPNADIVFDRFHVMKNYSKALSNQRRIEFRKADKAGKDLLKGTHYLVLKNADKLTETQTKKLQRLLENNSNLSTLYVMKEQLQALWESSTFEAMQERLEAWCKMADESSMLYLKKFAKSLRRHSIGICNYAKYNLTSARIEAGNVSIGMIRKRARGIKDTEYFKLKIRQSSLPDDQSMFYLDG
ncbi:MAG: ISL3 family transposase [Pseudomonadales bacterium]|nr:ISL3 family transposase [Pseudomonadales bacterium]MBL4867604.1 ISL3 family transposase [Pseudomonadales bacterium]MBL4868085.1 ISL3 family transposase [Pseudomonadales bacterium]